MECNETQMNGMWLHIDNSPQRNSDIIDSSDIDVLHANPAGMDSVDLKGLQLVQTQLVQQIQLLENKQTLIKFNYILESRVAELMHKAFRG